ncbi:SDR family oxidoreductase [Pedobacter sp. HDW13]|uniref:SDR family oxidoreductase n=1 Tax=unclassified Pedobacter TaxID=2628915 RepID=UPI000F5ADDDA|nr:MULTISPECIES: SDR family oxidoreductase [unclassified Pedobacter]QIL39035.1 SDR family oxidoreductase [Pedobacter sp. HDW13]RQO72675.1 short chain dehydrogenase [Pedobacter sp. KBW01]
MSKIVWITGASSGIGEALAYEYFKAGNKLIISGRNRDELFRVKGNCQNSFNVHVLPFDLNETETLENKAGDAIRIFGKIDLLINSGGVSQRSLALETSLQTEQQIMSTNFWGTVVLSKAVLPLMIANGGGQIVIISSLVGKFGTKLRSAYAASKHALHGYFDSLRSEVYDQNIDITIICPGFIKTQVTYNALTADGQPLNKMGDAHENAMSPVDCAVQIVKAITNKKEEVYIGGKETKAVLLKRFFPKFFSKKIKTAKVN